MLIKEVWFKPVGEFTFTDEEISVLMECSKNHYDSLCKRTGECGGFLYGMNNSSTWDREEKNPQSTYSLDGDKLDLLAKIAEGYQFMSNPERAAVAKSLNTACRRAMTSLIGSTPTTVQVDEDNEAAQGLRIGCFHA